MTNPYPHFTASAVDTPAGMNPAISESNTTGVPSRGTGLAGEVYITNGSIRSIQDLEEIIATRPAVSTFTATSIAYGSRDSDTTVAEFLADDAASIQGAPGDAFEMGPSGMVFKGFIYIPEGVHAISVISDDGFSLKIGGADFSEFADTRGAEETVRVANFAGGLYEVELLYFDAWGGQALNLQIDGLTVDQSAMYQSVSDFTDPPADVPIVPTEDYHPSHFIEDALDIATTDTPTEGIDLIQGGGADESIDGLGGDDSIHGGYGDDSIHGGDGDDVIDGGRGSDLIIGGLGNDLLISRSDGGEQRIGQLAIGAPTRPDNPDGHVNAQRQKLIGWEDHPLVGDDIMIGGGGRDVFLISPQINGKLEIIEKHVRQDGTINWAGVAGENTYLHDHWVDLFGIDMIADFVKGEDQIAVIGHTATVHTIEYRDIDSDGDMESIVTVISKQHGNGGAHDRDLIGQLVVFGDRVEEDDIITDSGVTYGIVETYAEVAEALFPVGETKMTTINGQVVYGYDTRDAQGGLGPVTGAPEDFIDNPYLNDASVMSSLADPTSEGPEETRYPFDQLGTQDAPGVTITGTGASETLAPATTAATGLPGALAFYDFVDADGIADGAYADARGGPTAKAYRLYENQALLRTDGLTTGPDNVAVNALEFDGEHDFAFIDHADNMVVTQGTIAFFVRPDDLTRNSTMIAKDHSGLEKGGHVRIGHTDEGQLLLRFADGDGRWSNQTWETTGPELTEGTWHHIAVNFAATGITVFVDGVAIPDNAWNRLDGDTDTPGQHSEAYLLQNEEPWVLGADSYRTDVNDTAQIFGVDDDKLQRAFDGAIAEFGVWGGYTPEDVLTQPEIADLILNGPGAALTNPSGPQPMIASDDSISGAGGNDIIKGEAGDDTLEGGAGDDSIEGGYGDDSIHGGAGDDTLDGGRGNDYVRGGDGDDLLWARSDAGEQRAGQLVLGEPSRDFPDPSIDPTYLKLVDWIDQPLAADDVLEGGAGRDTFYIQTQINGKKDILLKHIQDDRTIKWHGVAGENRRIHDHWVDLFGIDIIADFNREEDQIKIIGHTTNILDITYKAYDSDGDGVDDDAMSIVQVYSQQGNNGGAHDEDILGYAIVFGDLVTEDDIETDAGAHFGIVTTVDEIQEAVAPTGTAKTSLAADGTEIFGYDSRDIAGNPLAADPISFSSNPFLEAGEVALASSLEAADPPVLLMEAPGGSFDGVDDVQILPHQGNLAQREGSWAFSFIADTPGEGEQTLLSKDHSGYQDGGHLTIYIHDNQYLHVRFQGTQDSRTLKYRDEKIQAGEEYHVAFTFDQETIALYVNGEIADADDGFALGMLGNTYETALGASTASRWRDDLRLKNFFDGTIEDVTVFDRALEPAEAVLLSDAGQTAREGALQTVLGTPDADDINGGWSAERLIGDPTEWLTPTGRELLTNGDFEDISGGTGSGAEPAGWTLSGPGGGVFAGGAARATEGYAVPLGGWSSGAGNVLSQEVDTTPGESYRLTFDAGVNFGPSATLVVRAGSEVIARITDGPDQGLDSYSVDFTADAASTTLSFTLEAASGGADFDIDMVSLQALHAEWPGVSGPELLENGGFDEAYGGGGSGVEPVGWSLSGPGGGLFAGGEMRTTEGYSVPLGGWSAGAGNVLSQVIETTPGKSYRLSFDAGVNFGASATLEVRAGSEVLATVTDDDDPGLDGYIFDFTAVSSATTISFILAEADGGADFDIDSVSVKALQTEWYETSGPNLVANGDFEDTSGGTGSNAEPAGWALGGPGGGLFAGGAARATDGYSVPLGGWTSAAGNVLNQDIEALPGSIYRLMFDAGVNFGTSGTLVVRAGSEILATITDDPDSGLDTYLFEFKAVSTTTTLSFTLADAEGGADFDIDAVSVHAVQPKAYETSGPNLIANGDFEDVSGGTGSGASPAGWQLDGPGGGVFAGGAARATDGYSVPLGGWTDAAGSILSQEIATAPGESYRLMFDAGVNFGTSGTLVVRAGSEILATITDDPDPGLDTYTLDFTANLATTTISFHLTEAEGGADFDIDAVSVHALLDGDDDELSGGLGDDVLHGGGGDDTLTGDSGTDRFVFEDDWGADVITDFANDGLEKIDLSGVRGASAISALTITDSTEGAVISFLDNSILLSGLTADDLDRDDFVFALA
ncbi:MAG: LamG-like jellyroll fold domain-containing protein [Pseudomonadota bacterium]